jgi:hypothetical protein
MRSLYTLGLALVTALSFSTVSMADDYLPDTQLTLMPSLAMIDGTVGFGGSLGLVFSAGRGFYLGLDTGFYHWSETAYSSSASASVSVNNIPVLATFLYKIDTGTVLRPYMGVSAGVGVTWGSVDISGVGYSTSPAVSLELLARPGLEIICDHAISFMLEPKLGLLKGSFIFLPQAGIAFSM